MTKRKRSRIPKPAVQNFQFTMTGFTDETGAFYIRWDVADDKSVMYANTCLFWLTEALGFTTEEVFNGPVCE